MSKKTAEPNETPGPGSSESEVGRPVAGGWWLPGTILLVFVALAALLRDAPAPPAPPVETPAAAAESVEVAPLAEAPVWDVPRAGEGVFILLKVVDRRHEPWPATLTRGGYTREVPVSGLRVWAPAGKRFGRLGGERLADRDWTPVRSDSFVEREDGGFEATVLLYPGAPLTVGFEGPGAAVVRAVRCIDGDRRGATCRGDREAGWACACRIASRVGVYSDRWSVPWVVHRSRFEDGPVPVPPAVRACLAFPEVTPAERAVVVVAPENTPRESAKEAHGTALDSGEDICIAAPRGEVLTVGLGATFSPRWSGRQASAPSETRTWTVRPESDGRVQLPLEGGSVAWPVRVGPRPGAEPE